MFPTRGRARNGSLGRLLKFRRKLRAAGFASSLSRWKKDPADTSVPALAPQSSALCS